MLADVWSFGGPMTRFRVNCSVRSRSSRSHPKVSIRSGCSSGSKIACTSFEDLTVVRVSVTNLV